MKKELKDYLHLYLGCDVIDTDGNRKLKFHCMVDGKPFVKIDTITTEEFFTPMKLLLRPLSDITEEEGIHIARLALHDYINMKWFMNALRFGKFADTDKIPFQFEKEKYDDDDELGECWKAHMNIPDTEIGITIWEDFNVQVHDDDIFEVSNQVEITHYLLQRGFDIFLLIPAGLALDKTKTK